MDDRVRIYDLARRMNIPNQDIITSLRELGYDVKSHSSTIDASTVSLLITALGKKKQKDKDKDKEKSKSAKPTSKVAAPATAAAPAVVVKPRVLSRYRPASAETEVVPETILPVSTASTAVHAPAPVSVPALPGQPVSTVHAVMEPIGHVESAPGVAPAGQPAYSANIAEAALVRVEESNEGVGATKVSQVKESFVREEHKGKEKAEEAKKVLDEEHIVAPQLDETANKISAETINFAPPVSGQSNKMVVPAMPVRVAAPSIRATPPRPPKSHRQSPSERHGQKKEEKSRPVAALTVELPKIVVLNGPLTVHDLALAMNAPIEEIIMRLMNKGMRRTINEIVELELARNLAVEMEYEVVDKPLETAEDEEAGEPVLSEADRAALVHRPPVVTIMGHVDHGKTSLLDAIRQTKFLLTDSEAGGITQHIGAYHVEVPHEDGTMRQIVFLDTPGHEAFTAMRARGAKATDIAILVVAADDGVMPQTIEAIDHAKAANVPIIVAVNKIDKAGAEPERVLTQLMEHGLLPDKFGGETVTVNVSAKKRTGLDDLLEMILLVADIQDLRADPDKPAEGVIIEAELSRGKGAVATALVENGTLREGDFIVAGDKSGRVRALFDDRGQRVKAAGPSMPVEVLGLDEVPQAGDRFEVVGDNQSLKILVESRKNAPGSKLNYHVTLESLHDMLVTGEVKELNIIIKADVQGTAQAIADSVRRLSCGEVQVRVLRTASGDISENDVNLAASSNAIIVGFNVQPDHNANRAKEAAGVDVRTYSVIYQITDDLQKAIQGLIEPIKKEVQIGLAEVRQVFKFGKNLTIAGCLVTSGKMQRGALTRIEREGQIVFEGKLDTLKRFKDDAKEVAQGFECGMSFDKFNDLKEGDKISAFVITETKRS
jgi:translation initiation factor IF-2